MLPGDYAARRAPKAHAPGLRLRQRMTRIAHSFADGDIGADLFVTSMPDELLAKLQAAR